MGEEISSDRFSDEDHRRFGERCRAGVAALEELVRRPGFGAGPPSIGAELEMGLIGADARPAQVNREVLAALDDPRLEPELDRFNLELNSRAVPLSGRPVGAIGEDLADGLRRVGEAAASVGARPLAVGILPTLRRDDLGSAAMSDSPRFRALSAGIRELRGGGPFRIRIDGPEPLDTSWDDLTLEGAATGLHVHLRVPPSAFAAAFNAAQAAVAPALAVAGNSPLLLGRLLWEETRVALFGQAIDDRAPVAGAWLPSRASFGHGWIAGPVEPFAESVALHVPILPETGDEDPDAVVAAGGVPALDELRLHHGTVWRWNRAVLHTGDDPHMRVEMRALPAGPSLADMTANMAFLVGLTMALAPQMGWMARSLPFEFARRNFYAAARHGLGAVLLWPSERAPSPRAHPAADLVARLLPAARAGLTGVGVEPSEADALLGVIAERARTGRTGAVWQREALAALGGGDDRDAALVAMTEAYAAGTASGAPVHEWNVPD
jgi:hypothetical protein